MPLQNPAPTSARRRGYLVFRKILFSLSYKRTLSGLDVGMLLPNQQDKAAVFSKIADALNLISRHAPHRFAQIRRHVKRIWVFSVPPYLATWNSDLKTCTLDRTYVRSNKLTVEELAATIMHEATHARIESAGIPYREELRERIERLCFLSELSLAKRLPNGRVIEERVESVLKTPTTYWSQGAFQERNLEALHELGKDNWVVRLLAKWTERRLAKRRNKRKSGGSAFVDAPTGKE